MSAPQTLRCALQQAQSRGLPRIDAQMLLLHVLGRPANDRAWLISHDEEPLPAPAAAAFAELCRRRTSGEPVAYLTGRKEFYGLDLRVDARVLDPRPDTETLVDWALELLREVPAPRIIDLGTGSGAIALALAHARPDARVIATDRSSAALEVARANAQRLGLRVDFAQGHWLEAVDGPFDLIVSNPPYIPAHDPHLRALAHEPIDALVSGEGGLRDLRTITTQAPQRLAPGGWLLLEHGWDQAAAVRELLTGAGLARVASRSDLAGIARCSGGSKAGAAAPG